MAAVMPAMFSNTRACNGRQIGLRLALAGFLVRALIPVGFMPATLAAGGPIVLCHGGLAGAYFQALSEQARDSATPAHGADDPAITKHAHTDHPLDADDPTPDHSAWDHCPSGATSGTAALAQSFSFSLLELSHRQPDSESQFGIPLPAISSYQARAPPPILTQLLS
jgi:hypothetical protein